MKKATRLRKLAQEIATCILHNQLNVDEAEKYIGDILCEEFCNCTDDYLKNTLCEHGVKLSKECSKCNKL